MNKSRVVLHPVLQNKRSRQVFLYFFLLAAFVGVFLRYEFNHIIRDSGIDLAYGAPSRGWILSMLLSSYFQIAMVFVAALMSGCITAQFVVGPVRRMEQWLEDWSAGRPINALRVRSDDKFTKLVELINALKEKSSS